MLYVGGGSGINVVTTRYASLLLARDDVVLAISLSCIVYASLFVVSASALLDLGDASWSPPEGCDVDPVPMG